MTDWHTREWDKLGRADPYFGVLADPAFRTSELTAAARDAFFEQGERDVREVVDTMRQLTGGEFRPSRALDFGCGVGRLTIPLARVAEQVVAVDASSAMLDEARANCSRAGLTNVTFALSTPGLPGADGPFDFIYSYIVFQHIPPRLGYGLLDAMLDRLAPQAGGMLHFTFARQSTMVRRIVHRLRRSSRIAHALINVVQRRPLGQPLMAMFEYDIAYVLESLQRRGCERVAGRLTNHGGHLGVSLFFTRGGEPAAVAPESGRLPR